MCQDITCQIFEGHIPGGMIAVMMGIDEVFDRGLGFLL